MAQLPREEEVLRALRGSRECTLGELADALGLPRTNYGRSLASRVRPIVQHLVGDGLVEEHRGHYRLSQHGRRTVADRVLDSSR